MQGSEILLELAGAVAPPVTTPQPAGPSVPPAFQHCEAELSRRARVKRGRASEFAGVAALRDLDPIPFALSAPGSCAARSRSSLTTSTFMAQRPATARGVRARAGQHDAGTAKSIRASYGNWGLLALILAVELVEEVVDGLWHLGRQLD